MVFTRAGSAGEQQDLETLLDSKLEGIATKDCIEELRKLILAQGELIKAQDERIITLENNVTVQNEKITKLESEVAILKNVVGHLKRRSEGNEQYQRRQCLRINGIPPPADNDVENGEACLKKVQNVFKELKVEIPSCTIDRAHRIGAPFKNKDGKKCQTMIVKFATWRHRTEVYKARKIGKYAISPDLTPERFGTLRSARNYLSENKSQVEFVFADLNCRLMAKISDGRFVSFDTFEEFKAYC